MAEPASERLQDLLRELHLCAPGDLRRCRSRVRRLAKDLPAFDSVWIDALVQARKLTSFQAKALESPHPGRLQVGPCLLLDRLGSHGATSTFLARRLQGNQLCVLKQAAVGHEAASRIYDRAVDLVQSSRSVHRPGVVLPHAVIRPDEESLVFVSQYVRGPSLADLLVRRGRFPIEVVISLGRHLLDSLAVLQTHGIVHGDLQLANVRLTDRGVPTLVDTGITTAMSPELVVRADTAPERYDGIAPELIGTGQNRSTSTDLYALGSLLWHVLAGRPPFPTGDPLAKLAAHQSRIITDVREWAPDTPCWLAESITLFCAKNPNDRPESIEQAIRSWAPLPGKRGKARPPFRVRKSRLKQFRTSFDTTAPRIPIVTKPRPISRWTAFAMMLFVTSGAALTLIDAGARSTLLRITSQMTQTVRSTVFPDGNVTPKATTDRARDELGRTGHFPASTWLPLPTPNARGVIHLTRGQTYECSDISVVGPLTIESDIDSSNSENAPRIMITTKPLSLWAEEVNINDVQVRRPLSVASTNIRPTDAPAQMTELMRVQSQNVAISHCSFVDERVTPELTESLTDNSGKQQPALNHTPVAVQWIPLDASDRGSGHIAIQDTVFLNRGSAIGFVQAPKVCEAVNCLKMGEGAFLQWSRRPKAGRDSVIQLRQVTLRNATSLIQFNLPVNASSGTIDTSQYGQIHAQAVDCVFDLSGSKTALIQWEAPALPTSWSDLIRLTCDGSLARPGLRVLTWENRSNPDQSAAELDNTDLLVEGLLIGGFDFQKESPRLPADSSISFYDAPRLSDQAPGIDASRLPTCQRD